MGFQWSLKGVKNVALGKPVTSSVPPRAGQLSQITDGKKEATDDDAVEFKKGPQWVQVDPRHRVIPSRCDRRVA